MTTAVVFDYGFGNVRSMVRALANLGVDTTLTSDYRQSLEADGLVVPGVGAFAACMEGLKKVDGDRVIYDRIRAGRHGIRMLPGRRGRRPLVPARPNRDLSGMFLAID